MTFPPTPVPDCPDPDCAGDIEASYEDGRAVFACGTCEQPCGAVAAPPSREGR